MYNDFDNVLYHIILKHGDNYREKCYLNGFEPQPNNVLNFIVEYVKNNCNKVNVPELNYDCSNDIWLFREYYFQLIYGNGNDNILKIYNKKDLNCLIII